MAAKGSKSGGGHYRSSVTGQYVTETYGKRHPNTTEHERGPHKPSGGGSKKK